MGAGSLLRGEVAPGCLPQVDGRDHLFPDPSLEEEALNPKQRQGQVGGSSTAVPGMWPLAHHGEVAKGPLPSTQSPVSQDQAWSQRSWQAVVSGCYSPGDDRLGLPLHTDAHGDILAFSY